jgi:hypothetical protein
MLLRKNCVEPQHPAIGDACCGEKAPSPANVPAQEGTVSHQHKCLFVHIPKTAGRSIAAALHVPWNGSAHRTFQSYRRDIRLRDYFSFSVVRNPWDRFVSLYHHVQKANMHMGQPIQGPQGSTLPFASWLAYNYSYYKGPFSENCDFGSYSQSAGAPFWFTPQKRWLLDEHGKIGVHQVIKFENLNDELHKIFHRFGIESDIPWTNKGNRVHKSYQEYYDPFTKNLVANLAAEDIEAFGYSFD